MTTIPEGSSGPARPGWMELGIAALNGMVGDHLQARGNPLATRMGFRHDGAELALTRDALARLHPGMGSGICVLVHGLGCTESVWRYPRGNAAEGTTYGTLLQQELGLAPFYLRYNTGLPVADNGAQFASLMTRLHRALPVTVSRIVLIGHSMGGLVLRNACAHARQRRAAWVGKVEHAIYLGSPLQGADLEKGARFAAGVLQRIPSPVTRLIAGVMDVRSSGVRDLGFGANTEAPEASRWLASCHHHLVAGTLTRDPAHPAGRLLGDALVRPPGRSRQAAARVRGAAPAGDSIAILPGLGHIQLAHHPAAYARIAAWCRAPANGATP